MGNFTDKSLYHYQTLRCNVDFLKVIQLGITLFNADGEIPPPHPLDTPSLNAATYPNSLTPYPCTWQFNFQFSLNDDMFAHDSIEVLQKAGVDFDLLEKNGIDPLEFGAALIPSGLVLSDDVRWISYHSGYDFGYLLKIMLCKPLPSDETSYSLLINKFFPNLHDIKYIMKQFARNPNMIGSPPSNAGLSAVQASSRSGVDELANSFGIKRIGPSNQAGPDSLITGKTFFEMRRIVFQGSIDERLLGQVWGINGKDLPLWDSSQRQDQTTFANGNAPTTPNVTHAGLSGTPAQSVGGGIGALTPGGGGGVFGGFQFSKA
jgi:CCR4-NOT transcription complex subunit 7/8